MDSKWPDYYHAVQGRSPRPLFLAAVARCDAGGVSGPRQAIDLGCGDGIETFALLRQGWRVLAVDAEPAAIALVAANAPHEQRAELQTCISSYDQADLPPADLIYAGLSLPFCAAAAFERAWPRVVAALRPGGRLACHLFGDRDGYADDQDKTCLARGEVDGLLRDLVVEWFEEVEVDRPTALKVPKHWHIFEIIARKPEASRG